MRCNQVSIFIERFGEYVPKDYPADVQRIHVYCDDFKSIYAALSKAYAMVINELAQYENIGVRTIYIQTSFPERITDRCITQCLNLSQNMKMMLIQSMAIHAYNYTEILSGRMSTAEKFSGEFNRDVLPVLKEWYNDNKEILKQIQEKDEVFRFWIGN